MILRSLLPFLSSQLKFTASRISCFAALAWLAAAVPARAASVDLRVAIQENVQQVNVGSSVNALVLDGSRRRLGEIQGMNGFAAQAKNRGVTLDRWQSGALWIEPKDKNGVVWIGDRWYRGRVYLVPTKKGLTAVNYVDLEQYLFSVLGSEMNGNWPLEALKAQAVAARSYALHERQNSRNGVFDLGDTEGWQVYRGVQTEAAGTQQAVLSTTGQVLAYNGQIINAVFHSSAGGCTENVEDVWSQSLPYLRSVSNQFDEGSPVNVWSKTFSSGELSSRISGVGNVRRIVPMKTTRCKRVKTALVEGDKGRREISGESLRDALGLRSTLFTIDTTQQTAQDSTKSNKNNDKANSAAFVVNGRGFGHGLGMSQWGAYNMARQGMNYQQILGQYYQKTSLAKIDPR